MYSTCYSREILMTLELSQQIFDKHSNIKFNKNPLNGSGDGPCGQTDRHDEAYTCLSQFCEGP
jgi:hypothetical protein